MACAIEEPPTDAKLRESWNLHLNTVGTYEDAKSVNAPLVHPQMLAVSCGRQGQGGQSGGRRLATPYGGCPLFDVVLSGT
jgi:hypothetical protein